MDDVEITQNNFNEYFFDIRQHKPKKGQIMARYAAIAEFVDGGMKKNIIELLQKDKANSAVKVMRKLGCATEKDSVRICKEICEDMLSGISIQDIEKKSYKFTMEIFYYTQKEHVPKDDPHWSLISIINSDFSTKLTFVENNENE